MFFNPDIEELRKEPIVSNASEAMSNLEFPDAFHNQEWRVGRPTRYFCIGLQLWVAISINWCRVLQKVGKGNIKEGVHMSETNSHKIFLRNEWKPLKGNNWHRNWDIKRLTELQWLETYSGFLQFNPEILCSISSSKSFWKMISYKHYFNDHKLFCQTISLED